MNLLLLLLFLFVRRSLGLVSSMTYNPIGVHPKLYTPGVDPIMHLDSNTFEDTVFGQNRAFMVEFYADWCGHCRGFAPFFREFAHLVEPWRNVVTIAVINCADLMNKDVCSQQGISGYPITKYYPRSAQHTRDSILLDTVHSVTLLRSQLARMVVNEFNRYRYPDWPNFSMLYSRSSYGDLWEGVALSANLVAVIIEQTDNVGGQFLLDMHPYRQQLGARRAMSSMPLFRSLVVTAYPFIVVYHRSDQEPIYSKAYTPDTVNEISGLVSSRLPFSRAQTTTAPSTVVPRRSHYVDCEQYPERCRALYYASETDILKAMRMALLDEVIRTNDLIVYENFTALFNFVDLLAEHFPVLTFANDLPHHRRSTRQTPMLLRNSQKARLLFQQLRQFLFSKYSQQSVSPNEWERQFLNVERLYDYPFPVNASWQHCRGSSPEFRGYTCGLWTAFHALTVHTYMDTIKENVDPLKPLTSIRDWVTSFFGCLHCRKHFLKMTTKHLPLTSRRVHRGRDMVFYMWRAHNMVNARLHGDSTEDPQFEKRQFPPLFLCPTCHSGGQFSRRQDRMRMLSSQRDYGRQQWNPTATICKVHEKVGEIL